MVLDVERWRYRVFLTLLIAVAFALSARLVYLYLSDTVRFPLSTVKIAASFKHITRLQLETILSTYQHDGFFTLPVRRLQRDLVSLDWVKEVNVERIWPDILSIKLVEQEPVAKWNKLLWMTSDGRLFNMDQADETSGLPELMGPVGQENDVLQIYQKLSKLLSSFGLNVALLQLHENQSWDLSLTNGVFLHLGKQDLEKRLGRFCKVYHAIFAEKLAQLASVDLRYERGMAVKWRQQTGK